MKIVLIHLAALATCLGQELPDLKTFTPYSTYALHDTLPQPKISLEETTVNPFSVLAIKDTAMTVEDISKVLSRDYGELFTFVGKNSLIPGKAMAFYYSY